MSSAAISEPILCSPFREPDRHHLFQDGAITDEIVAGRRPSSHITPVPQPKAAKGATALFATEREEENRLVNHVREQVGRWRLEGYRNASPTSRTLLEYWRREDRERPLFFAQVEAVETAIYLAEVVRSGTDPYLENTLADVNLEHNDGLRRVAHKMATATGKTVVMAMLITWHALNKATNPQSRIHSDAFLLVAPGLTIRDRLRVLLPTDAGNYYKTMDLCPPERAADLAKARVSIVNYHQFLPRQRTDAPPTAKAKAILADGRPSGFSETPAQVAARVLKDLKGKKNIVVINDEAHHCYRPRQQQVDAEDLAGDDLKEAKERDEEARVWFSGVANLRDRVGVRWVHDVSATPFFLSGSGYPEGQLFPWVVSDFPLIDAIESGLTKIPRVPIDDSATEQVPIYRDLWRHVREALPKRGADKRAANNEPLLPATLEGALYSLYTDYEKRFAAWDEKRGSSQSTPPVFIVVCNNTTVSKLVFDWVAGWEQPDKTLQAGKLDLFTNHVDGKALNRPMSILVDSKALDSGEMPNDFKAAAATEIERFKREYADRFGRSGEEIVDADLLREVMNTVGKPGTLGEHVRCVVSVSMLTEGWDTNTVTHILGVRAFGTQLICEQVVGRALRRRSYAVDPATGFFTPEYGEVYGIPFSFIPTHATSGEEPEPKPVTRVRALRERVEHEIRFPNVIGYRYEIPDGRLDVTFTDDSVLRLDSSHVPTETDVSGIVGEGVTHELDSLKQRRTQTIAFELAKRLLDEHFSDAEDGAGAKVSRPWLFPQLLAISRRWIGECLELTDGTFPQLLMLSTNRAQAVEKIRQSIAVTERDDQQIYAVLAEGAPIGTTSIVDFDTTKPVWITDAARCHVSHVVADTKSWEQSVARSIERLLQTVRYVKNERLGFTIPYVVNGDARLYIPDYIVHIDDGHGPDDVLQLIVEVSGRRDAAKEAKVATARNLWVPGVNALGTEGRWGFCEILDPAIAQQKILEAAGLPTDNVDLAPVQMSES